MWLCVGRRRGVQIRVGGAKAKAPAPASVTGVETGPTTDLNRIAMVPDLPLLLRGQIIIPAL